MENSFNFSGVSNVDVPDVGKILTDFSTRLQAKREAEAERKRQEEITAENQRRWDITNDREEKSFKAEQDKVAEAKDLAKQQKAFMAEYLKPREKIIMDISSQVQNTAEQYRILPDDDPFTKQFKTEQLEKLGTMIANNDYSRNETELEHLQKAMQKSGYNNIAALPLIQSAQEAEAKALSERRDLLKTLLKTYTDQLDNLEGASAKFLGTHNTDGSRVSSKYSSKYSSKGNTNADYATLQESIIKEQDIAGMPDWLLRTLGWNDTSKAFDFIEKGRAEGIPANVLDRTLKEITEVGFMSDRNMPDEKLDTEELLKVARNNNKVKGYGEGKGNPYLNYTKRKSDRLSKNIADINNELKLLNLGKEGLMSIPLQQQLDEFNANKLNEVNKFRNRRDVKGNLWDTPEDAVIANEKFYKKEDDFGDTDVISNGTSNTNTSKKVLPPLTKETALAYLNEPGLQDNSYLFIPGAKSVADPIVKGAKTAMPKIEKSIYDLLGRVVQKSEKGFNTSAPTALNKLAQATDKILAYGRKVFVENKTLSNIEITELKQLQKRFPNLKPDIDKVLNFTNK